MTKTARLVPLLPFILLLSCSSSIEPPPPPEPPLAEVAIGPAGGAMAAEGFLLTVPAGAFDDEVELTLREGEEDFPAEDGHWATGQYLLEGLPTTFSQPLELSLEVVSEDEGEPLLLLGETVFVKSLGGEDLTWQPLEATHERGALTVTLEPTEESGKERVDYEFMDLPLGGTFYYSLTETAHFKIYRPLGMSDPAAQLGVYLEEAYTDIEGMGFSYAKRTRWPVRVVVLAMPGNRYGEAVGSVWGWNYGSLRFSTSKLTDYAAMRTTAGHEFFHLVQDFYDPRGAYARATSASRHYWVDEASSVWSEELFTDQSPYVSPIRSGLVAEPFEGLHSGIDDNAGHHGYGMSALIKWMVDIEDESLLAAIYGHIQGGEHPARAVQLAAGAPYVDWLNEFFQDYFRGLVYGGDEIPYMIAANWGQWNVEGEDDTEASFHRYPHALGAGIFKVVLAHDGFETATEAKFSLAGDSPRTLNVFKYKSTEGATLLGADADSVIVGGLKELKEGGYWLVAVCTNPQEGGSDFIETADHTLDIEIREGAPFLEALQRTDRLYYEASVFGELSHHFRRTDQDGSEDFDSNNFPNMGGSSIPGDIYDGPWPPLDFYGTSFTAEMSYSIWSWELSGTFSADGRRLLSLYAYGEASQDVVWGDDVIGQDLTTLSFTFSNIDLRDNYQIGPDHCSLNYSVQATPSGITYHRSWPYLDEDEQLQYVNIEYLGSDWTGYAGYGFSFYQSAP